MSLATFDCFFSRPLILDFSVILFIKFTYHTIGINIVSIYSITQFNITKMFIPKKNDLKTIIMNASAINLLVEHSTVQKSMKFNNLCNCMSRLT